MPHFGTIVASKVSVRGWIKVTNSFIFDMFYIHSFCYIFCLHNPVVVVIHLRPTLGHLLRALRTYYIYIVRAALLSGRLELYRLFACRTKPDPRNP